jgi:LPXTG-motif cell wall-anchored protein
VGTGLALVPVLPAAAADPAVASVPKIQFIGPEDFIVAAGQSKTFSVEFRTGVGTENAKDVVVTIDTTGLKGFAELKGSDKCTTVATTVTCKMGDLQPTPYPPRQEYPRVPRLDLTVQAVSGLKPGTKASLKVSATSSNTEIYSGPGEGVFSVTAGTGYDLAAGRDVDLTDAPAGGTSGVPISVTNNGDKPAVGVFLKMNLWQGLDFADRYKNCRYTNPPGGQYAISAYCRFDKITLRPGDTFAPRNGMPVSVAKDLKVAQGSYAVVALDDAIASGDVAAYDALKPETGSEFEFVRQGGGARGLTSDADISDNTANFQVVTNLKNDFAVLDASASGKQGDKITVSPGLENRGPARENGGNSHRGYMTAVKFAIPEGASVVKVPSDCSLSTTEESDRYGRVLFPGFDAKGRPAYMCLWDAKQGHDYFTAGDKAVFPVELKIDKVVPDATGRIQLWHSGLDNDGKDTNAGNDIGRIVLNPTKAPGTTTGSQTGGGQTGAATAGASGGTTTTGTTGTTGTQTNGGGGGKELANTGSDSSSTMLIAATAAGLIALGAGGLFVVRRRKNTNPAT